jgi:hypothetical protein
MRAKKDYDVLLSNGILLDMYPELTGNWKEDIDIYTKIWEETYNKIVDYEHISGGEEN